MLLELFQKFMCLVFLTTVLFFSTANSQDSVRSSSEKQGPLNTNLNPSQSFSLSKSESGFHSSGSRGNYEGSNIFPTNKIQHENPSADQKRSNSYVTPNVEELFETLRNKHSKWRFNSENLNIPDISTTETPTP